MNGLPLWLVVTVENNVWGKDTYNAHRIVAGYNEVNVISTVGEIPVSIKCIADRSIYKKPCIVLSYSTLTIN